MTFKPIARIGDTVTGICNGSGHVSGYSFTGTWVTGSNNCVADNKGIIRIGDTGTTNCGHHFHATTGSSIGTANGLAIHRVGDQVIVNEGGYGQTVTGSPVCVCA